MLSGSVWEIDDADQVDSQLWLPAEDVLICFEGSFQYKGKSLGLYTIINTDESGEKVGAQRLLEIRRLPSGKLGLRRKGPGPPAPFEEWRPLF